jgi:hypothetical protein
MKIRNGIFLLFILISCEKFDQTHCWECSVYNNDHIVASYSEGKSKMVIKECDKTEQEIMDLVNWYNSLPGNIKYKCNRK